MTTTQTSASISPDCVLRLLPHRYPFLLIDQVLELDPGKRVVCLKNVSMNEEFFAGHYPGHPVMPGLLIIEAMAQAGGFLMLSTLPETAQAIAYFSALDAGRFRRPVRPGDQLRIEATLLRNRNSVYKYRGEAFVDGQIACEAEMTVAVQQT